MLVQFLKETELFQGLSEEEIRREILPKGHMKEVDKGGFLLLPNEQLDYFGIILSGSVHAVHIFDDGNSRITVGIGAGEMFGADLLYTKTRIAPYHVTAVSPVRMLVFPVTMILNGEELSGAIQYRIMNNLLMLISQRNMKREYHLTILSQKGLRERIMTYLTMQANRKRKNPFTISFSREQLADYLCVNRSALSHELSLMQKDGLISFRKNLFMIHRNRSGQEQEGEQIF